MLAASSLFELGRFFEMVEKEIKITTRFPCPLPSFPFTRDSTRDRKANQPHPFIMYPFFMFSIFDHPTADDFQTFRLSLVPILIMFDLVFVSKVVIIK
jgi:hypothetical protein